MSQLPYLVGIMQAEHFPLTSPFQSHLLKKDVMIPKSESDFSQNSKLIGKEKALLHSVRFVTNILTNFLVHATRVKNKNRKIKKSIPSSRGKILSYNDNEEGCNMCM